jgi:hypothetical protein
MASLQLKLSDLLLDQDNPRISRAGSQRETLQKIIEDQDVKLVVLAESIVSEGLNPMDRWLVLRSPTARNKYIALEGNRRLAALRILHNPNVMTDIEIRSALKKRFEELATQFDLDAIGLLDCYEVEDRAEAAAWINQRHTGENEGKGIVDWGGLATSRFRGRDPALQAYEFVLNHGSLENEEKELLAKRFPISTLDRLLSTPDVRAKIGVEIASGKLRTALPATEVIKPLRRIVLELATRDINVTALKSKEQQVKYVSALGKDLPNLDKKGPTTRPVDEMGDQDFKPPPTAKPKTISRKKPALPRKMLIPRDCQLSVSNNKIAEIVRELRTLSLRDFPHSVSVLFRVFLEQSVDHYIDINGMPPQVNTPAGKRDKSLRQKVGDVIEHMTQNGIPVKDLNGISKGIDNKNSPLCIETLNDYVHNRFYSPGDRELRVAWDNSQRFFMRIWV